MVSKRSDASRLGSMLSKSSKQSEENRMHPQLPNLDTLTRLPGELLTPMLTSITKAADLPSDVEDEQYIMDEYSIEREFSDSGLKSDSASQLSREQRGLLRANEASLTTRKFIGTLFIFL